jgi:hypothetical protein
MSMDGFQKAMCDLVASPDLCVTLVESPDEVFKRYDLSDRDRRRLLAVVQQPGMEVNCALYRVNRLSPIYSLMPHTCFLLGDRLISEAIKFWESFDETRLQLNEEAERFGTFLLDRIEHSPNRNPLLADVIRYELILNEFRFTQRAEVLSRLQRDAVAANRSDRIGLHPLIRVLLLHEDPKPLLRFLEDRQPLPYELAEGEFWLLLDAKAEELEARQIEAGLGRLLQALQAGIDLSLSTEDIETLVESGVAIRLP